MKNKPKKKYKYLVKKILCGMVMEVVKFYSGRYGCPGNGREKKEKPSRDKVKRWQDKRAEDKCRWLMNTNFKPGDIFFTGHWPPKVRLRPEDVQKQVKNFLRELRKVYAKAGKIMRYIFSVGIGGRGAIHFHMVLPKIDTEVVEEVWQICMGDFECPYPQVNFQHLDRSHNYRKLAAYIVKNGKEAMDDPDRRVYNKRYCPSRNLKQPIIKTIVRESGGWSKTPRPAKGYYIDTDSVRTEETLGGYPYQSYAMIRLNI